ncbi:hypothetical protein CEXT_549451 [Caerostris extrusa]|uniref:Uncharacterized protein n=1 Tax=Caerostris extrusa TaxID=172846 RepID=A0AAV4XRQ4_CAEEX|nr:hypothetical protein CEXT_549451 [Caerostris extrusa]
MGPYHLTVRRIPENPLELEAAAAVLFSSSWFALCGLSLWLDKAGEKGSCRFPTRCRSVMFVSGSQCPKVADEWVDRDVRFGLRLYGLL